MSINLAMKQRNRLCTALACLLAVLSTIARADDRQRGAIEDGGQAGSSRPSVYGMRDDGDADAMIVVDNRGAEDVQPGRAASTRRPWWRRGGGRR